VGHHLPQKARRRAKVSVEHGDKVTRSKRQPVSQRPGLEPRSVCPPQAGDIHATSPVMGDSRLGQNSRFIRGVIQNLNGKLAWWIVQRYHGVNQSLDHETLVKDRQLNRHLGPIFRHRCFGGPVPMPKEQARHPTTMRE
jgi:hypothetical protein